MHLVSRRAAREDSSLEGYTNGSNSSGNFGSSDVTKFSATTGQSEGRPSKRRSTGRCGFLEAIFYRGGAHADEGRRKRLRVDCFESKKFNKPLFYSAFSNEHVNHE